MKTLSHEPLVHFALAAFLLFGFHFVWTGLADRADHTIEVSAEDLDRMLTLYKAEAGAPPTEKDVKAMIADFVRDQALAQEARRLGLDVGDTVVDRRLAQKMTFLTSDLTPLNAPSENELEDWYTRHSDRFKSPRTLSFDHIFFSKDKRGDSVTDDARNELSALNNGNVSNWKEHGDPFMLARSYGELPIREVARLFGTDFANAISQQAASATWAGPIPSAFGDHIVRVSKNQPAELPPLADIRKTVEADWREHHRRLQNASAINDIVSRYRVVIEGRDAP